MGMVYGTFAGLAAVVLLTDYNIFLGIVVFIAMVAAMMTAAILGVIAPTLLKRLNFDPAIASGPFVTTVNDITGSLSFTCSYALLFSSIYKLVNVMTEVIIYCDGACFGNPALEVCRIVDAR